MNTINVSDNKYDFESEENLAKWKGVLITALKRVLEQVHPSLDAKEDALDYVERLCLRLLALLCAKPSPHTVQDVEYRVQSTFPTPIDKWALKEAQEAIERGKKKSVLPVDKIHNLLQKELLLYKVDSSVSLFLVAVLEYISADILKLAGNYVKHIKHVEITYQDVQISMNVDKALMDLFYQDEGGGNNLLIEKEKIEEKNKDTTYDEVVRELMASERQYLRDLHMIIRVFREELIKLNAHQQELDLIFSNILDIYELTVTLLGSLEDAMEMAQEQMLLIGSCFEELAEAAEFDVYSKYARDVTSPTCREILNNLLARPCVSSALSTAGQGMKLSLKYYLPALLLTPIRHCFSYMSYIRQLSQKSGKPDDKETLTQVEGLLKPLEIELGQYALLQVVSKNTALPQATSRRQAALEKIRELEKIVENWDSKDVLGQGQCCTEFIRDGVLMKVSSGKRLTERRVFLFDGLIVLCKPNCRRQSSAHGSHTDYRLKEKFFIRKVEIIDHADTDELKFAFEICPRIQPSIILCCKEADDKNSWMADLVMLNNKAMLERILDSILTDIERKHPLKLPSPDIYKFAEPDSKDNIVLEQRENGGVPLIKGATLYKLVERLTYHIYADPKFIRTFLTTYRSFCAPMELLQLLIERFQIPEPSVVYEQDASDIDKMQKNSQREDWKRYKKEYCQPIQFRVVNVLRHWVDHHFYDFERDPALLSELERFLESDNGKSMRKWIDIVLKIVHRRRAEPEPQKPRIINHLNVPPEIEWHLTKNESEFSILTLHPVELARQLTLLEFDLYRTIKPSELVGSVWTKKDKEKTSPNLLKMIKHTTNITRWYEKNIVEAENFDERCAIVNRIIEIMTHLDELNNFNGVLAIVSAMGSASVHRLKFTFQAISQPNKKALEECRGADNHFKNYQEKLRSINPPCVPFVGMYLTNILHIEEGNPDFLPNTQLINFFKRRKVAEITGEIQQYQNQPYCYNVEPKIRHFLENLNPFADMNDNDISNYLFNKSIEIEPRNVTYKQQLPKFQRKWPTSYLKSPSSKVKSSRQSISSISSLSSSNASSLVSLLPQKSTGGQASSADESVKSGDDSSQKSDPEFSIFAPVQIPNNTNQNSPTLSPASPAPVSFGGWSHQAQPPAPPVPHHHIRSHSICSIAMTSRTSVPPPPVPEHILPRHSQFSAPAPGSPDNHSPASPRSYIFPPPEPISPHLPSTPPPLPPRGNRNNPEISSPQQIKQAPDAPILPPRDCSPPPLPPRRETGTLPRLHPTHTSQLHIRRHSSLQHPHIPARSMVHINGGSTTTIPSQPPSISPRFISDTNSSPGSQTTPRLPPKPVIKSAGLTTGSMFQFQYPSTPTTNCFKTETKE